MTMTDASYGRFGGTAVSSSRFCNVNIVMTAGLVSAVNYTGPTGGLLTAGEQCAYAVDPCVKQMPKDGQKWFGSAKKARKSLRSRGAIVNLSRPVRPNVEVVAEIYLPNQAQLARQFPGLSFERA